MMKRDIFEMLLLHLMLLLVMSALVFAVRDAFDERVCVCSEASK